MNDIETIQSLPPAVLSTRRRVENAFEQIEAEHAGGRTYREIAAALGINYVTMTLYIRDIKRTRDLIAAARAAA